MNPGIMVFRPTMEEFKDFNSYIRYMESENAHLAGVAKVIPPQGWIPRTRGYDTKDIMEIKIPFPITQEAVGKTGAYQLNNILEKPMTVAEFRQKSESLKFRMPMKYSADEIERKYWSSLLNSPPMYGADVPGFISDKSLNVWNISNLGTILDCVKNDYGVTIHGVNTPYLYFGMWRSSFAWHTEDLDLYSINYLHYGDPKTWYAIPPGHAFRFQRLAYTHFPDKASECPAFLRHKTSIISPHLLKNNSIPCHKITQKAGEIMITFPFSYHAGFNHGFNIAESTNFASPRWIEYGKRALQCYCKSEVVRINMDIFVKRFQAERYDNWLNGVDYGHHPEEPNRICAAPKPPEDPPSDEECSSSSVESEETEDEYFNASNLEKSSDDDSENDSSYNPNKRRRKKVSKKTAKKKSVTPNSKKSPKNKKN